MLTPSHRRTIILSALGREKCNKVPDKELACSMAVINALDDVILREELLLSIVLNMELVLRGARLCYLLDADTAEQGVDIHKRLGKLFPSMSCCPTGSRYLFFLSSRANEVMSITREVQGERALARLLGYGYEGDDIDQFPKNIVSLCVEDMQLYGFMVPLSRWDASILVSAEEKARAFTEALESLGFSVNVRVIELG